MSFAFRPKEYFSKIIASYYFRVLYKKENENEIKYLPMDSNLGNLCIPEKNSSSEDDYYYCYLKLKNDYNESKLNFSVSSTNQNEYVKIYIKEIFNNNTNNSFHGYHNLVCRDKSDVDYFEVIFKFQNNEIKNIISSYFDKIDKMYPHIYSSQMFSLDNFNKTHMLELKNSFRGNYQYINGDSGIKGNYYSFPNFKGRLLSLNIDNEKNITISSLHEFIYYLQLKPILGNVDMKELKQGNPLVEILDKDTTHFPLNYYYKIINKQYINININIKLSDHYENKIKKYNITGHIYNEDAINRKFNGEYIKEPTPEYGKYSDAYGIGYLQIDKNFSGHDINENLYLLITLEKIEEEMDNTFFFVEIMAKEYDKINKFFLPQNEYFIDNFDDAEKKLRDENEYSIFNPEGNSIKPIIELSSEYNDIEINFTNITNVTIESSNGFQRFIIDENITETIYFYINNTNHRKANFMIIYYLNDTDVIHEFILNDKYKILDVDKSQEYIKFSLLFEGLTVKNILDDMTFYITGTLFETNDTSHETVNNTCFLYERKFINSNKTTSNYNPNNNKSSNWTLVFREIPKDIITIYDLRLQIIASIKDDNSREEYMAFVLKLNLTDIKKKEDNPSKPAWYVWGIPLIVVGSILIIVLVYFVVKFLRLQKTNTNLQNKMVSLAFSNDVQKNVLTKDIELSKNESDYESTFI